jgi:omega-amidase
LKGLDKVPFEAHGKRRWKVIACVVQYPILWESPKENFREIETLLRGNPPSKGSLVLLPEMFATGFSMSPQIPDFYKECKDFLITIAKEWKVFVGGGIAKRKDHTLRNAYVLISPLGEEICEYHKAHPFSVSEEGKFYSGGKEIVVAKVQDAFVAPTVCYDLRFPELYRRAVIEGAEVMIVAANWPAKRDAHWQALLKARAIENQAYVIGVNRTGEDPNFSYCGSSSVISPDGKILLYVGETEGVFCTEIDLNKLRVYREKFAVLKDMKPWLFHYVEH